VCAKERNAAPHPEQTCGWENGMEERSIGFFRGYGVYVLIGVGVLLALLLGLWWFVQPDGFDQKITFLRLAGTVLGGATLVGGLLVNFWGQWINQKIQDENQKHQIENQKLSLEQFRLTQQSQEQNQQSTLAQLENAQEELRLTRQGQMAERFTQAIDQLGSEFSEIRLGGIYALERIARESEADYWSVIVVLTAYIRTNVPWPPTTAAKSSDDSEREKDLEAEAELSHQHRRLDIQAILYILRDRKHHYGSGEDKYIWLTHSDLRNGDLREIHLDRARLRGANLKGARLDGAHLWRARLRNIIFEEASLERAQLQQADLEEAILCKADLEGAYLRGAVLIKANIQGANLRKANLRGAFLEGANLQKAKLQGAYLRAAKLQGANLQKAKLQGANLRGAYLRDAYLQGADLGNSLDLTDGQLEQAYGDQHTLLPDNLKRPAHWGVETDQQTEGD
jgi:uncharacterized protein YjbI with pentapeptide repeats